MKEREPSLIYSDAYFRNQVGGTRRSAEIVLGRLFEIYRPVSVVDFGCGRGIWLAVAESLGSKVLKGFDGDWISRKDLHSSNIDFTPVDMEGDITIGVRCDLAMSLETAEHLSEDRAESFVGTLCEASDVVLFSAAIENQGGSGHINEQWQSYWIGLFQAMDYKSFDVIRGAVWNNDEVAEWYRQNVFLFVNSKSEAGIPFDREALKGMEKRLDDVVHPKIYRGKMSKMSQMEDMIQRPSTRFVFGMMGRYLSRKLGISSRQRF